MEGAFKMMQFPNLPKKDLPVKVKKKVEDIEELEDFEDDEDEEYEDEGDDDEEDSGY